METLDPALMDELLIDCKTPADVKNLYSQLLQRMINRSLEAEVSGRHNVRLAYWEKALETFHSSHCSLFNNISPSKDHWLSAGSGVSGCLYKLIFLQKEIRVELWIAKAKGEENTFIFWRVKNHAEFNTPTKSQGIHSPEWIAWHLERHDAA